MKQLKNLFKKYPHIQKFLLISLVALQVGILIFTLFVVKQKIDSSSNSSNSSFPFIPIWAAIFIPIIAIRKKEKQTIEQKQRLMWLLIGLAILVLLGMIVFLIKISS
ncbi:hypothetical protein ACFL1P_00535 [Patescibacteria group bacterium]